MTIYNQRHFNKNEHPFYHSISAVAVSSSARAYITNNATKRIEQYFDPVKNFRNLIQGIEKNEVKKFRRIENGHPLIVMLDIFTKAYSRCKNGMFWRL